MNRYDKYFLPIFPSFRGILNARRKDIMKHIVLFDGECHFCDASVQFIIKRDRAAFFQFASLQSAIGQQLRQQHHISDDIDSIVLIEHQKAYTQSTAALHIAKKLDGLWKLAFLIICIPRPIRDKIYTIIAKNRYRWFGKKEQSCTLPPPSIRKRFLS